MEVRVDSQAFAYTFAGLGSFTLFCPPGGQLLHLPSLVGVLHAPFPVPLGDKGLFFSLPCLGHLVVNYVDATVFIEPSAPWVGWSPWTQRGCRRSRTGPSVPGTNLQPPTPLSDLLPCPAVCLLPVPQPPSQSSLISPFS